MTWGFGFGRLRWLMTSHEVSHLTSHNMPFHVQEPPTFPWRPPCHRLLARCSLCSGNWINHSVPGTQIQTPVRTQTVYICCFKSYLWPYTCTLLVRTWMWSVLLSCSAYLQLYRSPPFLAKFLCLWVQQHREYRVWQKKQHQSEQKNKLENQNQGKNKKNTKRKQHANKINKKKTKTNRKLRKLQVLFLFFPLFFVFVFFWWLFLLRCFFGDSFFDCFLFYFLFLAKINFLCSTRGHNFMYLIFSVDQGDYSTLVLGGPLQNSA